MDLILEARAFVKGVLSNVEIGVDESTGKIEAVKRNLPGSPRRKVRGLLLPSAVDWHVHFRDPGFHHKEDFFTGTKGAALGGVGTVLDMPNTKPVVDRVSVYEEKRAIASRRAVVDWDLWGTLTPRTPRPEALIRAAAGAKLFLGPTTNAEEPLSDEFLRDALRFVAAQDKWTVVHAESSPDGRALRSTRDHELSRPAAGEVEAIARARRLVSRGAKLHVAHATTADAVEASKPGGFSTGATPHHLLLSYESHADAFGKVNPPLRSESERRRLWDLFAAGGIPHLESDHAPHTLDEKSADFQEAPSGVPGVETMMPLLLRRVKAGEVRLAVLVASACERPADDLGIKKGRIEAGYDADFFSFDPRSPTKIRGDRLASKCGWTPFEGHEAFLPQSHYLRGEPVVEDGELIARPGRGRRILRPEPRD